MAQIIHDPIDELFSSIGRYVVVFQWLEGIVDKCLLLLWGYENWHDSQYRLARMSNKQKVEELQSEFYKNCYLTRCRSIRDFVDHFDSVILRLHKERGIRNELVHSQYLIEFLEAGDPILRSDRQKKIKGKNDIFHSLAMTSEHQKQLISNIAKLAVDLGRINIQLTASFGGDSD